MNSLIIALLFYLTHLTPSGPDAILGNWYTEDDEAKVKIYKCGDEFCGKIVWLKDSLNQSGEPMKDVNNPEAHLRDRSLMGLKLLYEFEYGGDGEWDDGEIYDPETCNTYDCYLELIGEGKLKVRGYVGVSVIGRTSIWHRPN